MSAISRWTCPQCARPYRIQLGVRPPAVCPSCEKSLAAQRSVPSEQSFAGGATADLRETDLADLDAAAAQVLLTTSNHLDGHHVDETLQLVAVERVCVVNALKDLVAGSGEVVSGRAGKVEAEVRKLRESCLRGLRREAYKCGANAVVAIQLTCSEISSARSLPMMMMLASGTAVRVTRTDDTISY
ncbi:MAG: heavy metal-binding domain-containing protein [Planctomycetia bacterium]|nr:heavy metal-binding domain-containing protein [Planctomycetia bacterium]